MKFYLILSIIILLNINIVFAQPSSTDKSMETPEQTAKAIMTSMDYNHDGMLSQKEYMVMDGHTAYRTHLSNMYESLNIADRYGLKEHEYWFIELFYPNKYTQDLADYFKLLDKDNKGFISTKEYENTFTGNYISQLGHQYAEAIDADKNGKISYEEYTNFDFTSAGYKSFQNIDLNKDGFITFDEMSAIFKAITQLEW